MTLLKVSIFREGRKQQEVATEKKSIVIGREAGCDIVLEDRTVSRRHAEIEVGEDAVVLKDLGSSNGTYVNRERIESHTLAPNDAVTIGSFGLKVRGHVSLGGESSGAVDVDCLATHDFAFDQTQEAYDLVADYRDGVVKAMIHLSPEA